MSLPVGFSDPGWLWLLVPAMAIVAVGWLGASRTLPRARRIASLVIRLVLVACLVLALAGVRLALPADRLSVVFLLDASASMDFPVATKGKWNLASQLAIGLAAVARSSADPVGLVVARNEKSVQLQPRTRQGVIHEMIRAIAETGPGGSEPVAHALTAATRLSGRIVLITDFLGDADDLLNNAARAIAGGREVHAVHVIAPEEIDPPRETLLVSDPEAPDVRRPLTGDARDAYLEAFGRWRDRIAHDWSEAGVSYNIAIVGSEAPDHIIRRVTAPRGMAASA